MLEQKDLSVEALINAIRTVETKKDFYKENIRKNKTEKKPAQLLAEIITLFS